MPALMGRPWAVGRRGARGSVKAEEEERGVGSRSASARSGSVGMVASSVGAGGSWGESAGLGVEVLLRV